MSKVIRLTNAQQYEEVITDLLEGLRDNSIKDFVLIAHQKLSEPDEDHKYQVRKYWFGEDSCVKIMGLLQYMLHEIWEFILGREEDN